MALSRYDYSPQDSLWDLVRKLLTNLNGLVRGDFGILTRGTFEIAPSQSTTAATPTTGVTTVTTAGTPVRLASVSTLVYSVIVEPARDATGRFWLGSGAFVNLQTIELPVTLSAPDGKKIDLNLYYVDGTVNGEVVRWEGTT